MTAKHFHIALLLLGFTLFVGCGFVLYDIPPHLFINQNDCIRAVCIAKFEAWNRATLVGIAYGIPVGLLAMIIACQRLQAADQENPG